MWKKGVITGFSYKKCYYFPDVWNMIVMKKIPAYRFFDCIAKATKGIKVGGYAPFYPWKSILRMVYL